MIGIKIAISADLLDALDLADKEIEKALRLGVYDNAKQTYDALVQKAVEYDWQPPRTTGNLKDSIGFLVKAGGAYNIHNYNAVRVTKRTFERVPIPDRPKDAYSAKIFVLAPYASFLEFGTRHMAARPFFFETVMSVTSNIDQNVIARLQSAGFDSGFSAGKRRIKVTEFGTV